MYDNLSSESTHANLLLFKKERDREHGEHDFMASPEEQNQLQQSVKKTKCRQPETSEQGAANYQHPTNRDTN